MKTITWRKCLNTSILELIFIKISIGTISLRKMINEGWKDYYGLENNCKLADLWLWDKKRSNLRLFSLLLSCIDVNFGDVVSLENPGER
jgi:hypothetical protein